MTPLVVVRVANGDCDSCGHHTSYGFSDSIMGMNAEAKSEIDRILVKCIENGKTLSFYKRSKSTASYNLL